MNFLSSLEKLLLSIALSSALVFSGCSDSGTRGRLPRPRDNDITIACGDTILEDTVLTEDLECKDSGLIIGANGVTLDCDDYAITGNFSGNAGNRTVGVSLSGIESSTIVNCEVWGFLNGIELYQSNGNVLRDNDTSVNNDAGIYLEKSDGNYLVRNVSNNNLFSGVVVSFSDNNILKDGIVKENRYSGIYVVDSSRNELLKNLVGMSENGIVLSSSESTKVRGNVVSGNSNDGIIAVQSHKSRIVGNYCEDNLNGILLNGSSDGYVMSNFLRDNDVGVYLVLQSDDNLLKYNTFVGHTISAHEDSEMTGNVWNNNYWADFGDNEGYPDTYVIDGLGGNVDIFPQRFEE